MYNELSQILEYGVTNQIAPFAINAQSAQFIIKIIFTKNGTCVQNMLEGLYGDLEWAEDIESVQRSPLCDIRAILRHLLSTANKQGL